MTSIREITVNRFIKSYVTSVLPQHIELLNKEADKWAEILKPLENKRVFEIKPHTNPESGELLSELILTFEYYSSPGCATETALFTRYVEPQNVGQAAALYYKHHFEPIISAWQQTKGCKILKSMPYFDRIWVEGKTKFRFSLLVFYVEN